MVSRHRLRFSGFVVTGILMVGAGLIELFEGLSALSGGIPATEEFLLVAMLSAAAEWVIAVIVLGLFAGLFLVATAASILRTASIPRDDRLASAAQWLERRYPALGTFDVSERVAPTTEERRQELEEEYVSGELSEAEFERRLARLMDARRGAFTSLRRLDGRSRRRRSLNAP
ncbi:SHOCT domain-containing protein [Halorubrum sp. SP9]|uniref:SHOCT domain-containing protein n=1 Tax=Halorubrum sp. SP9 TaxID=1537267 RepID=UPI0010F53F64|nr:SHOCT domain-containing protein [Halorubrum sp. SP9]TKX70246.1 SHOCT domain-containing protein [Halorubrum sp. SP9]